MLLDLFLFLIVAATSFSLSESRSNGERDVPASAFDGSLRIVGGDQSDPDDFPYFGNFKNLVIRVCFRCLTFCVAS